MIKRNSNTIPDVTGQPIEVAPRLQQRRSIQGLVAAATAIIAVALVATAIVFAIATGTTDAADQGTIGVLSEASLGAAAAAHNETAQAQIIAEASSLGMAAADELDQALERVEAAAAELVRRTQRLTATINNPDVSPSIRIEVDTFLAHVDLALIEMQSGDISASALTIEGDVAGSYRILAGSLAAERDAAMARIELAGKDAGRLADAARFLVVLLVPLAVLLAYRKRVRRERLQRDLEHELETQQAVSQTRDEFIANLSHELRTPLTAIYGFSLELIEPERTEDPQLDRELATFIASESAELSRMVEDILTAASADQNGLSISMATVDPVAEVDSVVSPLRATGATIASDLEDARILTDPLRFRQVVRNLVSNALRHGGPNNLVAGRVRDESYVIEVRDDGPGIPAALEERLFTRFIHQGDEPLLTGSVGLGLSIVQLLIARIGGTIAYRREHDETVFAVSFPLASFVPLPKQPDRSSPKDEEDPGDSTGNQPDDQPPQEPDLRHFGAPQPAGVDQK